MMDQYRVVRRHGIELRDRRQALFLELELGEAAGNTDELAFRRALGLLAQQVQRFLQAVDTVPANLEIVVHRATDRVGVAVVQAGDHPLATGIDHLGEGADQATHLVVRTHGDKSCRCARQARSLPGAPDPWW